MFNVLSKPFFQGQIIATLPNRAGQVLRIYCVNGLIFVGINPLTGTDATKIAALPAENFATYKAITDTAALNFIRLESTFTDTDITKLATLAELESKGLINAGFSSWKVLTDLPSLSSFVESHEAVSVQDTLFTVKMVKYLNYESTLLRNNGIPHLSFDQYSAI